MKRTLSIISLTSIFLSTAAFAQSVGEQTGVNSALGIAPKTVDFIKEAAISDMLEIEAANRADDHGSYENEFGTEADGQRRRENRPSHQP